MTSTLPLENPRTEQVKSKGSVYELWWVEGGYEPMKKLGYS